jgi:hypothetical protein
MGLWVDIAAAVIAVGAAALWFFSTRRETRTHDRLMTSDEKGNHSESSQR